MRLGIVGATGAVGQKIIDQLEIREFPISSIRFFASVNSAGKKLTFKGESYEVEELTVDALKNIDLYFFSAGSEISKRFAIEASKNGAVVIDNTNAFRMDSDTPLVVPEVNKEDLRQHHGIIANPNCSTIQLVAVLHPLRESFGLKKVIVSTYQAVSGAGSLAIDELKRQTKFEKQDAYILPVKNAMKHYPIAYNAIPQIDQFGDEGFTIEEWKMMNETKKILHDDFIEVSATCVRLPVVTGHSESVYVEFEIEATVEDVRSLLSTSQNVVVQDDTTQQLYPMPLFVEGCGEVFVGRIRRDPNNKKAFHLWIVADNLLKGAALNAIQIAETLVKEERFCK